MPPLVMKWQPGDRQAGGWGGALVTGEVKLTILWAQSIKDDDRALFPLLACLTSIAQATGPGFLPYTEGVFARCVHLIQTYYTARQMQAQNPKLDVCFVFCFPHCQFPFFVLDMCLLPGTSTLLQL